MTANEIIPALVIAPIILALWVLCGCLIAFMVREILEVFKE